MNSDKQTELYRAALMQNIQNQEELERILKEQNRTTRNKLLFLFYYGHTLGSTAKSCRLAGIKSRSTIKNWKDSDPRFEEAMRDTVTYMYDLLEDKAKLLAFNGNGAMIRFLLDRFHPKFMRPWRLKKAERMGLLKLDLDESVQFP